VKINPNIPSHPLTIPNISISSCPNIEHAVNDLDLNSVCLLVKHLKLTVQTLLLPNILLKFLKLITQFLLTKVEKLAFYLLFILCCLLFEQIILKLLVYLVDVALIHYFDARLEINGVAIDELLNDFRVFGFMSLGTKEAVIIILVMFLNFLEHLVIAL